MQLRSVRHDSYDQFAEIFSSRYLQYPTLPLQFLTSKKSIGPMILSMRNMGDKRGAVLTQSAKVCTHRVRRPPFWLIVTALDRNRYLPVRLCRSSWELDKWFHHTHYNRCNYLSMFGLKLIYVSKRGTRTYDCISCDIQWTLLHLQEHQCNPASHVYVPDECYCQCINEVEALRCAPEKLWDNLACACVCRRPYDCPFGEHFNTETCQ